MAGRWSTDATVTIQSWEGESAPLHAVAAGYVFLAAMSDAEIAAYCDRGLRSFRSEHTDVIRRSHERGSSRYVGTDTAGRTKNGQKASMVQQLPSIATGMS